MEEDNISKEDNNTNIDNNITKKLTALDVHGKRVMDIIMQQDANFGGHTVEISGGIGSGKTAVLLFFAEFFRVKFPNSRVIWNNSYFTPSQFMRLEPGSYDIFVERGKGIYFQDINKQKSVDLHEREFTTFPELWEMTQKGRVSVVFFGDRRDFMKFSNYIQRREGWCYMFIDEASDVFPADESGQNRRNIAKFASSVKELRKCKKSTYYCSQIITSLDYRVRRNADVRIYGPASRVDAVSRVYQKAVDKLQRKKDGVSCFISIPGEFGLCKFTRIYKPAPDIQACVNEVEEVEEDE